MSEKHALRNAVLGTVVGGIILSLIQWLTGLLTPVWNWLKEFLAKLWATVLIEVTVPVWLIAILVAASAALVLKYKNILFQGAKRGEIRETSSQTPSVAKQHLNDKEKKILAFHAGMEVGYVMTASEVTAEFKIHREEAQYYLDQLQGKGYIEEASEADTGEDGFQLTKKGRKYLIENKLLEVSE